MRHALLIEESAEIQLAVRATLEDRFEVTCATTADEALRAVGSRRFDLIMIDVALPGHDSAEEVRARIESHFAKGSHPPQDHFWKADLRFAVGNQRVSHAIDGSDRELDLTPNEFRILFHLAKNEGRTMSRSEILHEVWGEKLHVVERTVDKHICSLRRKMGDAAHYVASVPGRGYEFRPNEPGHGVA